MKFVRLIIIIIASCNVSISEAITLDELPSKSFREDFHPVRHAGSFDNLADDPRKRVSAIINSWAHANQSKPVDNRAYLYALAIDLYNSIPPDLQPELRELGPDEDAHESTLAPVKRQLYSDISVLDEKYSPESIDRKKYLWDIYIKKFNKTKLRTISEIIYLKEYLRKQIAQGNVVLDASTAPASLDPAKIDILNPTYYKELQKYMEKMKPAIEALVPPWEVENPNTAATKEDNAPVVVTKPPSMTANQLPKPATARPTTKPITDTKLDHRVWYVALGILILLIVAGVLIRRRQKHGVSH